MKYAFKKDKSYEKYFLFLGIIILLILCVNLALAQAQEVKVTLEHPFLINGKWIPASELKVGDLLTTADGKKAKITYIEDVVLNKSVNVYNLEAGEYSNFILPGEVVVHNSNNIPPRTTPKETYAEIQNRLVIENGELKGASELEKLRITEGQELLGLSSLTPEQQRAILLAHYNPIKVSKAMILGEAGFSGEQITVLGSPENMIIGTSNPYVGRRIDMPDPNAINGRVAGIITQVYGDGRVEITYNSNRGPFKLGDSVVIERSGNIFSKGTILEIHSTYAKVLVDRLDVCGKPIIDPKTGQRVKGTRDVPLKNLFLDKAKTNTVVVEAEDIISSGRGVVDKIQNAIKNKEIVAIDPKDLNNFVAPEFKMEGAKPELMKTISPGMQKDLISEIGDGDTVLWVLTEKGNFRFANKNQIRDVMARVYEIGIKHIQLALGEKVVYAGTATRDCGKLFVDLKSGTFSRRGINQQYNPDVMNNRINVQSLLSLMLPGERIEVVNEIP